MGVRLAHLLLMLVLFVLSLGGCVEDEPDGRPPMRVISLEVLYEDELPLEVEESLERGVTWWEDRVDVRFHVTYTKTDLPDETFDRRNSWPYYGPADYPVFVVDSLMTHHGVKTFAGLMWFYNDCDGYMVMGREASPWLGVHELGHMVGLHHLEDENNVMDPDRIEDPFIYDWQLEEADEFVGDLVHRCH